MITVAPFVELFILEVQSLFEFKRLHTYIIETHRQICNTLHVTHTILITSHNPEVPERYT